MSRRNRAEKREIHPDPVYHNLVVAKFINVMMVQGKKNTAETILYKSLDLLKEKMKKDPLEMFLEIVNKVKPKLEVRSRRVGGATYQVPMDVRSERQEALALRWLISFARKRGEKTMSQRLLGEFSDVLNDTGNSLKKRADTHKMAEANRAFAHFRW